MRTHEGDGLAWLRREVWTTLLLMVLGSVVVALATPSWKT